MKPVKRLIYGAYVFLVSFEALIILLGILFWTYFNSWLLKISASLHLDGDVPKYLALLPLVLVAWIAVEGRALLQDDNATIKTLTAWSGYWRLKLHVKVAILYSLFFAAASVLPWIVDSISEKSGLGLLIFFISVIGQLIVAGSIYDARVRVKEILNSGGSAHNENK